MLDIIGTLLDVALKIFGLRDEISKAREDRKPKVADFIASIGANIAEVSSELKKDVYPHGSCEKLRIHSEQMVKAIGDLVGEQRATELAHQLHEVWQIEQLYGELKAKSPEEKARDLHKLDQAAGLFSATADIVRVSP